ncbi:hypothetical protein GJ496_011524 [Pomphorhynchus laevis]|nr:hypothetical protein GJ496_011524 [Pomphorhynchus laevis]
MVQRRVILVHPVALFTMTDHYTRTGGDTIYGVLLGKLSANTVEVLSCIPLQKSDMDRSSIEESHLFFVDVFEKSNLLGWYTSSQDINANWKQHDSIAEFVENPLLVILKPDQTEEALPIQVYCKEIGHVVQLDVSLFTNETVESIATDFLTLCSAYNCVDPSANRDKASLMAFTKKKAAEYLHRYLSVLIEYIDHVMTNGSNVNHSILRDINSVCNSYKIVCKKVHQLDLNYSEQIADSKLIYNLSMLTELISMSYKPRSLA